jgi:catechol 2,3-dioxygenase-like lactoylglutathione lyase family enzyme
MRLDHAALIVSDPEAAKRFYVGVLGLEEAPRPPTFTFPGFWVRIGDRQLHVIGEAEPGRAGETHPGYRDEELAGGYTSHFAIHVDDLDRTLEGVRSRGGEIVGGPRPRGDGVLQAYVEDPDGNVVEFMQTGVAVTGDEPEIGVPKL